MSTSTERVRRFRQRQKKKAENPFDGRSKRELKLDALAERLRLRLARKK